jgi:tetratricopeptide (TPR) repeat protein
VAALAGVAILVAAVVARRTRPVASFAVLWLLAALLPSSSVVPLAETVVDHRAYVGSVGIALLLGTWLTRLPRPRFAWAVIALLALRSLQYEWILADPVRAWKSACARVPHSPLALRSLADAYASAGEPALAESTFAQALALAPEDVSTLTNVSTFYASSGRFADALRVLDQALTLVPPAQAALLHDNRGMILLRLGRIPEAVVELETSVRLGPERPQPRITLAQILIDRGDRARARAIIDETARLRLVTPHEALWIERLRAQTEPGYRPRESTR